MEYYKRIQKDEHMLYTKEIAESFGIETTLGKPHSRFISQLIQVVAKLHHKELEEFYYNTRSSGLVRVYSIVDYLSAMLWLKDKIGNKPGQYRVTLGDHNFNIVVTSHFFDTLARLKQKIK